MKVNHAHQKFILKLRGHSLVFSKCVSIQEKNIKQQVFC